MRLFSGTLKAGDRITVMSTNQSYEVKEVGVFTPEMTKNNELEEGAVGYVIANIKDAAEIQIGDTLTNSKNPSTYPLPGFKEIHPMVFAGIYPVETSDYEKLGASMDKLRLNDASFSFQSESSVALGFGFRCGFLGLLHMEIIMERLRREFNLDIISSYPNVVYKVYLENDEIIDVDNPMHLPDQSLIDHIDEPMIIATIILPTDYIGEMMQLIMDRRGEIQKTDSIDGTRVMLTCKMPLNEVLIDFYDKQKLVLFGEYIPFVKPFVSKFLNLGMNYTPGIDQKILKLSKNINAVPMICFESIFNYKSINTEVCNADMVIQISNDSWFGKWYGPHQHLANSLLRSVEFQKPLIRSTPSGITSVVDYSGKIIDTIPTNKKGYLYYQHPINKYKSNCSSTLFSVSLLIFLIFLLSFLYVRIKK